MFKILLLLLLPVAVLAAAPVNTANVTTSYAKGLRVEFYSTGGTACSSNPCTPASASPGFTVNWNTTGSYTINFTKSFSGPFVCLGTGEAATDTYAAFITPSTTYPFNTASYYMYKASGGTLVNARLQLICIGPK